MAADSAPVGLYATGSFQGKAFEVAPAPAADVWRPAEQPHLSSAAHAVVEARKQHLRLEVDAAREDNDGKGTALHHCTSVHLPSTMLGCQQ